MGCVTTFRPSSLELMRGDALQVDVVGGPNYRSIRAKGVQFRFARIPEQEFTFSVASAQYSPN